jgi:hypothetical protein
VVKFRAAKNLAKSKKPNVNCVALKIISEKIDEKG